MKLAKHIESIVIKRDGEGQQQVVVTLMPGFSFEADDEVICKSFASMAEARTATAKKRLHGPAKAGGNRQAIVKCPKKFVDHQSEHNHTVPHFVRINQQHYVIALDSPDLPELAAAAELTMDDDNAPRGLRTSARAVYNAITRQRPDLTRQLVEHDSEPEPDTTPEPATTPELEPA